MRFVSGDLVYFETNRALGFLLEREFHPQDYKYSWRYILRSPIETPDSGRFRSTQKTADESMFIEGVDSGRLRHYTIGRRPG